uniref:Epididymal peptidase inhibitor n=2 Tax=Equus asinus TaxID=9793 RepID=A0A9L0K0P3_EQUAS
MLASHIDDLRNLVFPTGKGVAGLTPALIPKLLLNEQTGQRQTDIYTFWNCQTGQLFFRMESSRLLRILVLSILLVNVQGSNLSGWLFPRRCPKIQERCEYQERDECTTDEQCPDKTKCCVFSCGKKCLDLLQDVCKMPKETGPCLGLFQRWWYDKKYNTCSTFIYGGCQGNNNNFQSKAVCQNICSRKGLLP